MGLFSSLIDGSANPVPATPVGLACACGACGTGLQGEGGAEPVKGVSTTPADNAYRFVGMASGPQPVPALMAGSKWTGVDAADARTTITYSFADPASSSYKYSSVADFSATLAAFSGADRALVRQVLDRIEAVCKVHFVEVADNATECGVIRYGYSQQPAAMGFAGYSFFPSPSSVGGDVWISGAMADASWNFYRPALLVHETLHAMGLKHPFSGGSVLSAEQDLIPNTVMSYSPVAGAKSGWMQAYPAEPMALDIAALQSLYGATATNNAGTGYNLASSEFQGGFHSLWDAGGLDTLDASGVARSVVLDLREGAASDIGTRITARGTFADGHTTEATYGNTLTLAAGTAIENAVGSAFADRITGNALANALRGGAGDDTLDGAAGIDTAVYAAGRGQCEVVRTQDGWQVRGAEGTDSLAGMERLQFADGGLALDLGGNAGNVAKVLGAVFGAGSVANAGFVAIGLQFADGGMNEAQLVQLALDVRLGAGASAESVQHLLAANVPGFALSGGDNVAIALAAADSLVNAQAIDLVGLAAAGLPFSL